jgi:hypothetical protein
VPALPVQVIVHDLVQGRAALAVAAGHGVDLQLRSAGGAAAYAGVGLILALGEALGHELLIDCGDDPGLVMAALRTGCRKLVFSGRQDVFEKLLDMAEASAAELVFEAGPPADCLTLAPDEDAAARLGTWLAGPPA